jgi:hypothetical protein
VTVEPLEVRMWETTGEVETLMVDGSPLVPMMLTVLGETDGELTWKLLSVYETVVVDPSGRVTVEPLEVRMWETTGEVEMLTVDGSPLVPITLMVLGVADGELTWKLLSV